MIAPTVIAEIRRLLREEHLSQRRVARRMQVSRGTVQAIATGNRPEYEFRRRHVDPEFTPPSGPWKRCPHCGGLVQMPCLACRVRTIQQRHRHRPRNGHAPRR
jgi:DNA-binding XRE family transcriptional regulator